MRILITGATGFLGGRILAQMAWTPGLTPVGAGRNEAIAGSWRSRGLEFLTGSLEDAAYVQRLLQGADVVVHAAALSSPWGAYDDFYRANVLSTKNLLDAAGPAGVSRFIYISTPSIYFNGRDRLDVCEDDPLPKRFVNHYTTTKWAGEQLALASGIPCIVLRPRAIIGAGDCTILPRLIRAMEAGRLRIIGNGQNIQDLTAAANAVRAVFKALDAPPAAWNQAYNITNGEPVRLWDTIRSTLADLDLPLGERHLTYPMAMTLAKMMETAARISGSREEPVLSAYGVGTLARSNTFSIEKARRLLGYAPEQTIAAAVQEFVDWYKSGKNLPEWIG